MSVAWFAIHAKPRQEVAAATALQREGVLTFYPQFRRKKTVRRKLQWVTKPLFPGYFFAQFDPDQSQRLVRYARGVANIVNFGGKPAPIGDDIIAALQSRAENEIITIPPKRLRPGELVEIEDGPLRGLQAIFKRELSGPERVEVLLQMIHAQVRVQLSSEILSPAR